MPTVLESPNVGRRIRDLRVARRLTLRRAADRAGISAPAWSQYERSVAIPGLEATERIAVALDVTVGDLLNERKD